MSIIFTTVPSADMSTPADLPTVTDDDFRRANVGPDGNLSVGQLAVRTVMTSEGQFSNGYALVGKLLNGLGAVTNSIQSTLIGPLASTVVAPLLDAVRTTLRTTLGLTIAGSTYTPLRTPSCGTPALAG